MSFFKKKSFLNSTQEETPTKPTKRKLKPVDIIIKKLKNGNKDATNMPQEELEEWAQSLCIESDLKEWYLNSDFASTVKTVSFF
jgi:hypothetical protein